MTAGDATRIWLGGVVLAAVTAISGCDGPAIPKPPYPPDSVIQGLTRGEVRGLYGVLRDFRANGERVKEISPNGHLVRVRMSVPAVPGNCPAVSGHPYDSSWVCEAHMTGVFQLRNKFHKAGASVNDGNVEYEFRAAGDRIKLHQRVLYGWNAPARVLAVRIEFPGLSGQNFTRAWGRYNMKGTSTTRVQTATTGGDVSFGLPLSAASPELMFSGSVSKTEAAKLAFVRVLLNNNPYWANEGPFQFARNGFGTTTFGVGMDWLTDALAVYDGTVVAYASECTGTKKHRLNGSFQAKYMNPDVRNTTMKAAIKVGSGAEAKCQAVAETLAARLYFHAANATACSSPASCPEAVGERFRAYVRVRDLLNGTCARQYDAAFTAAVNWNLRLETSGGKVVTGFDLGSSTSVWGAPSSASFATTYACG